MFAERKCFIAEENDLVRVEVPLIATITSLVWIDFEIPAKPLWLND